MGENLQRGLIAWNVQLKNRLNLLLTGQFFSSLTDRPDSFVRTLSLGEPVAHASLGQWQTEAQQETYPRHLKLASTIEDSLSGQIGDEPRWLP